MNLFLFSILVKALVAMHLFVMDIITATISISIGDGADKGKGLIMMHITTSTILTQIHITTQIIKLLFLVYVHQVTIFLHRQVRAKGDP